MDKPSEKSLAEKLGFNPGDTVFVETTPAWYSDLTDTIGVELEAGLPATHVHLFCERAADLADFLDNNRLSDIKKSLWISWPKKTSGVKTDLSDNLIRSAILPFGWVDIKVVSVDDTWSALQFVRRKS
ncbi:MAG TPA: DUF3052 domain-containing protein [Candidatus Saccharimonadia bacterium]|nr:DUF3052 domain-containing protein [Candidatus Saccharimonadia bacterium]